MLIYCKFNVIAALDCSHIGKGWHSDMDPAEQRSNLCHFPYCDNMNYNLCNFSSNSNAIILLAEHSDSFRILSYHRRKPLGHQGASRL